MANDLVVQEFVKAIKEEATDTNRTYNATVSRIDNEGVVWVNIHGSDKETPTASTSTEVKRGDAVTVNWRNNKLYIGGNYSNPSAGTNTVMPSVEYIAGLVEKNISVESINSTTAYIGDLTSSNITAGNIVADHATVNSLDVDSMSAATAYIDDLTSGNVTAQNIIADHGTIGSLDSNYAHITNGVIDNATIDYADIDNLDAHYAEIDLANVNNAWIQNGVIKDAAISNEMVNSISANKLTAGTIDASNITVTNLNASNITTGSITVDGITIDVENNEAVIDGGYIEDGTITMNGLAQSVQDAIDGAIETFTGTVVPTLNNSPASSWTTTALKDQHIGDVYYVVNSSSEQNGYCYRFTKSGSTYSWQLIKDSDVTAALARLQTAEGKIGDIEAFDQTMATFKTDTEGEISTLQTKTTNLETSLGDKVSTSTFNELSQTVDGNSASITTLTTTVQNKADSSTVTTLSNTVNNVSQKADSNESKISNLTTLLQTNADGTTASTDIVHQVSALDQDLDSITTRVGKTEVQILGQYATSSTAQGTTAKVATITPAVSGWTLYTGATITVKFTNANTATTPTLNINSTGAKTIKTYSGGALSADEYKWKAGSTFTFTYNGTYWLMQDSTASTRLNSAETSITQTATSIESLASNTATYTKPDGTTGTNSMASAISQNASDITLKVSKNDVINQINVSTEGITIDADKVNITGATIFTSGRLSETTLNNTYAGVDDIPTDVSELNNDSGYITSASVPTKTSQLTNDSDYTTATAVANTYATQTNLNTEINQRKATYGTCSTGASTQAKVVTCANFELVAGNEITVKFSTANTYASGAVQLNVNSKGAKNVWVANAVTSASNQLLWGANAYITFRYDGTQFIVIGEPRSWYGASTTAAGTAAKTDTTAITGAVICKGAKIELAMTYGNTNTSATLNIQSTGAKAIYYGNTTTRPTSDNGHAWIAATTATFTFDGAYYRLQGQTVINGDNVTTGTISANRLDVAGIITAGTIAVTGDIPTKVSDLNNDTGFITDDDVPTKVSDLTNDTGFITSASVPTKVSDLTNDSGYQTASQVSTSITNGITGKADKTDAVARSQRIYYRNTTSGAPSKNTTWLSTSGTGYGNWSLSIPQMTSGSTKYPYLYTAVQTQTVSQQAAGTTCTCSDVLLDETTTVIDGGTIITGTVNANAINASSGTFDTANIPNLSADKITTGTIEADLIGSNSITTDKLAANAITIGKISTDTQSQILNSEIEVGGRNLIPESKNVASFIVENASRVSVTRTDDACTITNTYSTTATNYGIYYDVTVTAETEYTLSFTASSISGTSRYSVGNRSAAPPSWNGVVNYTNVASGLNVKTFTTPSDCTLLRIYLSANGNGSSWTISNLKLEKGNVATDWSSAPEDVDAGISDAAKTATSYITYVDATNGIKVHNANDTTNYAQVNSNGLQVYQGGSSVAEFGSTARIGKASARRIELSAGDTGLAVIDSTNNPTFAVVPSDREIDESGFIKDGGWLEASGGTRKLLVSKRSSTLTVYVGTTLYVDPTTLTEYSVSLPTTGTTVAGITVASADSAAGLYQITFTNTNSARRYVWYEENYSYNPDDIIINSTNLNPLYGFYDEDNVYESLGSRYELLNITNGTGVVVDANAIKFGQVVSMELRTRNTATVNAQSDAYVGYLENSNFMPAVPAALTGFWGARALIGLIDETGVIQIRNASSSSISANAATESNPFILRGTWVTAR